MKSVMSIAVLVCLCGTARGQYGQPPAEPVRPLPTALQAATIDQRLNEQVPLDLVFREEAGRSVQLVDLLHGKPAILVLAYYRCPMLCTQVLNGLLESLKGIPFNAGEQYQVIAVSFDAREQPELAAAKKASYVENYGRPGGENAWHFLTGDAPAIEKLTQAVGFHYFYDRVQDQFAHASGIMVLTPEGRLARYFYGINYPPRDLRLALVEASESRIGSKVDQLLLYCYHYDPATGRYAATAMNLVRLGGIVFLLGLVTWLVLAWRRELRKRSQPVPVPAGERG